MLGLNYLKTMIISVILIVFSTGLLSAGESPISKGAKLAGGSLAYTSRSGDLWENGNNDRLTITEGQPVFMFFIAEGFAAGIVGLSQKLSQGKQERSVFGLGPEIQYYFDPQKEEDKFKGKFLPFVSFGATYLTATKNFGSAGETTKEYSGFSIRGKGGVVYMMSNSIGMTIGLSYSYDKLKQTEPEETNSLNGGSFMIEYGFTAFIF